MHGNAPSIAATGRLTRPWPHEPKTYPPQMVSNAGFFRFVDSTGRSVSTRGPRRTTVGGNHQATSNRYQDDPMFFVRLLRPAREPPADLCP